MKANELKVLTKLDFINISESTGIIDLSIYDITFDKLDIELIEYITSNYGFNYSSYKNRFLNKLFEDRYILISDKTDISFCNISFCQEFSYIDYTENKKVSIRDFIGALYNVISSLYSRYELEICNISNQLFSKIYTLYNYYHDEDNNRFTCIRGLLDEDEEYILYNGRYYHLNNCIEAYTGRDYIEYVPVDYTYEYCSNWYTRDGLEANDLVMINGDIFSADDCVYCEDTGNTIHIDDAYFCDDTECWYEDESSIEDKNGLRGYHKSTIENKSNNSTYKIGFEIEKEDSDFSDFRKVRQYGWDAERDGSLDDNGFELISPIYDLMNLDTITKDIESIKEYINADFTSNCGGHINVSVIDKNASEIFDLIRGYLPLLYAMFPNRIENRFCKAKKVNEFNTYERYEAINFTKGHILEFRIFGAVRNVNNLLFRYKLIKYMFENQRKGAASVVRMLLIDSELKKLLLSVYSIEKYNKLVDRVIKYTDIYMSTRDIKTTTTLITKMKQGQTELETLINN